MKTKALTILVLLAGVLVFSSCSKYEEGGPMFSKKGTLATEWTFDDFDAFGDDKHTSEQSGIDKYEEVISFTKDGEFDLDISFEQGDFDIDYAYDGKWEFFDDKNYIRMLFKDEDDDSWTETWKIIKLKKKELIIEKSDGDRYTYTAE